MLYHFDDLAFQILTIDRFTHKEGFFDVAERPYAAFSFRVKGSGMFKIGNRSLLVKQGDILFLPADTPYQVEYSSSESIVAHLRHCNYFNAETFRLQNPSEASLLFTKLVEDWQTNHSVNQAKAAIYSILDRMEKEKTVSIENTAFASCLRYIESHYCEPTLHIGNVCKEGFISVSGLHRAFMQQFGMSPMQYVIKLRMEKALHLLAENNDSVKEIAFRCGFTDEKYFSRAIKHRYGVPPSQLRNHIAE
ncbi:MAG: helix-turn-helix domain-containing protein [Ruminococcaceae bacterium]|nr:helix-turn-helix domain-containing protein [Oscillospiraceae bacterium]